MPVSVTLKVNDTAVVLAEVTPQDTPAFGEHTHVGVLEYPLLATVSVQAVGLPVPIVIVPSTFVPFTPGLRVPHEETVGTVPLETRFPLLVRSKVDVVVDPRFRI